ncbi:MAG: replicative DNA helicase [Bacteroidales bacterium]|nr:replicative DNA helicase [Bacteroidales bacterium]
MAEKGKKGLKSQSEKVTIETVATDTAKIPPHSFDLEEAVLAQILIDPDCHQLVKEEISQSKIFYDPRNRMIFEAMQTLMTATRPVDVFMVIDELRTNGNLASVGGAEVIVNLSNHVSAAFHIEGHIKRLKEMYIQRELITAAGKILADAFDESADVEQLINRSQSWVYDAVQNNIKRDVEKIDTIINRVFDELEKRQDQIGEDHLPGVPSGIRGLDEVTLGFQPSDLIILAARPSVGKTALALNIARNAAVQSHIPVAFFSLEMPSKQLVNRLLLSETSISSKKLKGGEKIAAWEWQELTEKSKGLSSSEIYIDDTPALPVMEFASKAKRLVKEKNVKLLIVDYLQLMQGPTQAKGSLREQEVAAVSRMLKSTAKDLNVPIIALSQLSRMTMQRAGGNNRPQLNDLRESGSIEQDADMVLFIHRYDYQNSGDQNAVGKTELIIAKHRNGALADIPLRFIAEKALYEDDNSSSAFVQELQASASNPGGSGEFGNVDTGF